MTIGSTSTNLLTLAVNLDSMQRLLGRRTADGTLVQADPALIEAAIAAGREQVASVKRMLGGIPHDAMDPWQRSADNLAAAVADLDGMLDMLEEMLSHLSGWKDGVHLRPLLVHAANKPTPR